MTITVTQEDIDKGIRKDCAQCPITNAVARHLPALKFIETGSCFITGSIDEERVSFNLPTDARWFVLRFDNGYIEQPFTFELV